MQHRKRPDENTYVLDIESAVETARLTDQHGPITRAMGGLCPEIIDFSGIKNVLDIACGPGGWALDVALAHPEVEVIGIDLSDTMVRYAFLQMLSDDFCGGWWYLTIWGVKPQGQTALLAAEPTGVRLSPRRPA
jgi:tRNA G46 methylase TrmB